MATSQGFDSARWIQNDLQQMRNAAPGHIPPKLDHHGFERKQHNLIVNKRVDRLQNVEMPQNWQQPPRFSTRSQLRQTRASEMLPHASFDVDGDGFVGAKDYAIAKKHDLADSGRLTGGQRDSAIAETCRITGSSLRDDEIGGNTKARRVLTSLRDTPELADAQRREQRLRVGQMYVSTLRNKSSHQLKECLKFPEAYMPPAGAPVSTRSELLAQRRVQRETDEKHARNGFLTSCGYEPDGSVR